MDKRQFNTAMQLSVFREINWATAFNLIQSDATAVIIRREIITRVYDDDWKQILPGGDRGNACPPHTHNCLSFHVSSRVNTSHAATMDMFIKAIKILNSFFFFVIVDVVCLKSHEEALLTSGKQQLKVFYDGFMFMFHISR